MSIVDLFFQKKQAIVPRASNIRLQQIYKKTEKEVHVFVEDQDDYEFFRVALKIIYTGYEVYPYYQKGKKNVIDAYNEINWKRFDKSKVLFFIDKDYDDILNRTQIKDQNIFITKYYSIENYLVNLESLEIILKRFHGFEEGDLLNKVMEYFNTSYDTFADFMETITPFILIYRKEDSHLKLDCLKLHLFFHFNDMMLIRKRYMSPPNYRRIKINVNSTIKEKNEVRKLTILEILCKHCEADPEIFQFDQLIKNKKKLQNIVVSKNYIRGKYELWFLLQFFSHLDAGLKRWFNDKSTRHMFGDKNSWPKRKTELNTSNIFDMLSSKITIPQDIHNFLTQNYNNLNANS
jgi:hypothetical protein